MNRIAATFLRGRTFCLVNLEKTGLSLQKSVSQRDHSVEGRWSYPSLLPLEVANPAMAKDSSVMAILLMVTLSSWPSMLYMLLAREVIVLEKY